MRDTNTDLFDPRTVMDSDTSLAHTDGGSGGSSSSTSCDFAFVFNDSNFSDRVLRIEIVYGSSSECRSDEEGCNSIADWARHRKRRREDIKKENENSIQCVENYFSSVGFSYQEIFTRALLPQLHFLFQNLMEVLVEL